MSPSQVTARSETVPAQASGEQRDAPTEAARGPMGGYVPELAALAVVIVWGLTFTLTKAVFEEVQPLAFGFARFIIIPLIAFAVLAFQARRHHRPDWWRIRRADLPLFVITGLCGYTFYQVGFMIGLDNTSPFSGALMISLQPVVVLAIVTTIGERQPVLVWLGALVALAGVAMFLFNRDGDSRLLGNAIAFFGGASFALYQVFNRRLIRAYPPAAYSAYSTLFGAIPLLLIASPQAISQDWGAISLQSWLIILYMSVFPVYLAYIAWGWAISKRGVAISGLTLLVPVVAGVLSMVFFNEAFGPLKLVGGALALAGMLVMQRANRKARPTAA